MALRIHAGGERGIHRPDVIIYFQEGGISSDWFKSMKEARAITVQHGIPLGRGICPVLYSDHQAGAADFSRNFSAAQPGHAFSFGENQQVILISNGKEAK